MRNFEIFLLFEVLLFTTRCVPSQHRLDFDLAKNALVACDNRLKIKHVTINEKNGGSHYIIDLKVNNKGSSIIFLDKENEGYYCNNEYPLKFKPNREYIISSISGDSGLEMSVFTNSGGEIDSVSNRMGCLKGD